LLEASEAVDDGAEKPEQDQRAALLENQKLALQKLQQNQDEQLRQLQDKAANERDKISADSSSAEQQRLASLRRAVARQSAQFASQGLTITGGGSADAVLLGMFEESDSERAQRDRLDDIRNRALDQDIESRQRLNILQRSQLEQQQRLERATSY
jgi:hypothetical protein